MQTGEKGESRFLQKYTVLTEDKDYQKYVRSITC